MNNINKILLASLFLVVGTFFISCKGNSSSSEQTNSSTNNSLSSLVNSSSIESSSNDVPKETLIFTMDDLTIVYDTYFHFLEINEELPEGVSVEYINNGHSNAGTYKVKAEFTDVTNNYIIPSIEATLTIEKAKLNEIISIGETKFAYDGTPKGVTIENLPSSVKAEYTNNSNSDIGIYDTTITFNDDSGNYILPEEPIEISYEIYNDGTYLEVGFIYPEEIITKLVKENTILEDIPNPAIKNGYKGTWDYDFSKPITEALICSPIYELETYTIEYVLPEGVSNNIKNPTTYTYLSESITLYSINDALGMTFDGWYTTEDYTPNSRINKIDGGSYGDLVLYPKFIEYKIEYAEGFEFNYTDYELPAITMDVSHTTTLLTLSRRIQVSEGCTWILSKDIEGFEEVKSKNMSLNEGHNILYITVWYEDYYNIVYIVDVYKLSLKGYSFEGYNEVLLDSEIEEKSFIEKIETVPVREGYTFVDWTLEKDSYSIVEFPYQINSKTTFYPIWIPNIYEITYDVNGGNELTDCKQKVIYDTQFELPIPTRNGYNFKGWEFNGVIYDEIVNTYCVADDITLVAQWEVITYNIFYYYDDAILDPQNPNTYNVEQTVQLYPAYLDGYTFYSWYFMLENDENQYSVNVINPYTLYGELHLGAFWTINEYSVTYNLNGGINNEENISTFTVEDTFSFKDPIRTGYTFEGWYLDSEFNTKAKEEYVSYFEDIVLYAKWKANKYKITYDPDGGTLNNNVQYVTFDQPYTLLKPIKNGYSVDGYLYNEEDFVEPSVWTIPNDVELKVKWKLNTYTITYNLNGGENNSDNIESFTINDTFNILSPTREGYTFKGWYIDSNFETKAITSYSSHTENIEVYAKWEIINYSITYYLDGGENSSENIKTFTINDTFKINSPYKKGHTFEGWFLDGEYNSPIFEEYSNYHEDLVIYAKWNVNTYTINYYLESNKLDSKTIEYGENFQTLSYSNDDYEIYLWGYEDKQYATNNVYTYLEEKDINLYAIDYAYIGNDFTFKLSNNKLSVSQYSGTSYSVNIPMKAKYNGNVYSVTSIGNSAFYNCSSLTSITLPITLTSIGDYAFRFCYRLVEIYNLSSLNISKGSYGNGEVGYYAKVIHTSLEEDSILIEDNNGYVFYKLDNKYHLIDYRGEETNLVLPETINGNTYDIGDYAFEECNSLTSIEIPEGVTSIGYSAFYDCSSLTSIEIPKGVTSIRSHAFYGCSSLTSITLPFIGETINGTSNTHFGYIFGASSSSYNSSYVPSRLKEVVITGGTSIGDLAFYGCSSLTSIIIPEGVTSIEYGAFKVCSSLTSITLPSTLTSIGDGAFEECNSLTSIEIPKGVSSIGYSAFCRCSSLTSITLPFIGGTPNITRNTYFGFIFGAYYSSYNGDCVPSSLKEVIITGGTSIGSYAFSNCYSLTSITLPSTLTSIRAGAFENCNSLTSIEIPEGVTSIEYGAFNVCSSLTSITLPSTLTSIGDGAFEECNSLTSIELPSTLTSIESDAFRGCNSLTSITLPSTLKSIGNYAFSNCYSLKSIELPSTLTSIGNYAFEECNSLTSIEIPEGVTSIGYSAFYDCSSLTSIIIPEGVTSIESDAFRGCNSLTSIELPSTLTSIGEYAFECCLILKTVYNNSDLIIDNSEDNGCVGYYATNIYNKGEWEYVNGVPTPLK